MNCTIEGKPVRGLIDSGNIWRTAISKDKYVRMGFDITKLVPIAVKELHTAQKGAKIKVLGETGMPMKLQLGSHPRTIKFKPIIIDGLSMDFNISGPFLQNNAIDQLHSRNCLLLQGKEIPLLNKAGQPVSAPFQTTTSGVYLKRGVCLEPQHIMEAPGFVAAVADGKMTAGEGVFQNTDLSSPAIEWQLSACNQAGLMSITLINTSPFPVELPKGKKVGEFLITEEEGSEVVEKESNHWTEEVKKEWLIKEFRLKDSPWLKKKEDLDAALKMLLRNWSIYSTDGSFGKTSLLQHEIDTGKSPPIKCRYRPISPFMEKNLLEQLHVWLDHDVIEESNSPWSFALVAAPKKNNKIRWCVDYRRLNAVTRKDAFPLPLISDNLSRLAGSQVFSGIDGMGAFHVVEIKHQDKPKTAFSTPWGMYHFKRMPFGLSNGPASYSRLMQMALRGIEPGCCLPYLDDTIIFNTNLAEHLHSLDLVLRAHAKAGLKLQPSKCHLFQDEVEYLGHLVNKEGIQPLRKYVEVVQDWPIPSSKTEARAFIGKTSYYRRFISNYSKIAKSWTDVMGKEEGIKDSDPIEVTEEMKKAFGQLKEALLTAPILAFPRLQQHRAVHLGHGLERGFQHGGRGTITEARREGEGHMLWIEEAGKDSSSLCPYQRRNGCGYSLPPSLAILSGSSEVYTSN